jgi:hypothetical protein
MKKYIIFSIIFIAISALFVYIQDNSFTTFNILGVNISLPNAVWISFFLGIFFLFSLIFIVFLNLKSSIFQKNINKDIANIIENIKNKILYKNDTKNVKVIKDINNFVINDIEGLQILPKKCDKFEFLEDIEKIINGEVIEISKYKLKEDNPWFIKNVKNKLKKEPSYAKEVLKKFKNEELKKEAFYIFANTAPIKEILKYDYPITLDILLSHINDEGIEELIKKAKLTPKEEIEFARKLYSTKTPDEELQITSPLYWANAYLALKYEHLELAEEIIETHNLKFFKFFLYLRKAGVKADVDEYIDSEI